MKVLLFLMVFSAVSYGQVAVQRVDQYDMLKLSAYVSKVGNKTVLKTAFYDQQNVNSGTVGVAFDWETFPQATREAFLGAVKGADLKYGLNYLPSIKFGTSKLPIATVNTKVFQNGKEVDASKKVYITKSAGSVIEGCKGKSTGCGITVNTSFNGETESNLLDIASLNEANKKVLFEILNYGGSDQARVDISGYTENEFVQGKYRKLFKVTEIKFLDSVNIKNNEVVWDLNPGNLEDDVIIKDESVIDLSRNSINEKAVERSPAVLPSHNPRSNRQ